ncbi:MAG: RNA 2'-phosphotransferase [Erysipelotrichaceae bacterium]|nr:RNA 2'-phosphotransferase [Erysipelotrichaceae bacterium]
MSKRISKQLCYVLRHAPESIGISLDNHGWAKVKELIQGYNEHHSDKLDRELLEKIVAEDDKMRYSFSEDGSKIRCNQGHSIQVDVELEEKVPPKVLYHGTGRKYVGSIFAQGLLPKTRLYVHLSKDVATAIKVGSRHGEPVVFEVDSQRMVEDGYTFYLSVNGVWLTKLVPAKYLMITEEK